jgi:hypothetical protein
MHHYQRRRASITGLVLKLREIIETGRLVVVAWRGLFSDLFRLAALRDAPICILEETLKSLICEVECRIPNISPSLISCN